MYHHDYMGYFFAGHWLLPILLVGLTAIALFLFYKWKNGGICYAVKENNLEILKNRLARGEINEEEFDKLKSILTAKS